MERNDLLSTGALFLSFPQILTKCEQTLLAACRLALGDAAGFAVELISYSAYVGLCATYRKKQVRTMSNIKVSYAEIEQSAAQLGQGREEITAKLQSLQQQIQNLVSSGFVTDQASVKFNAAYNEYTTSANTVVAKLNEIQSFLTGTANAMRDMDAQIAARIN